MRVPSNRVTGSSLLKVCLFVLIILAVMLPSDGDHGLLSPKSLSFVAAAGAWVCYLIFNPRLSRGSQRLLIFFISALSFLLVWLVWGGGNEEFAFAQFKVFAITLFTTMSILFLIEEQLIDFPLLLKIVIRSNFIYSLAKVSLVALHTLHIFDLLKVMQSFGIRYMSMNIIGDLGRMQTSVDILTPFILYFVLTSRTWGLNLSKTFKNIFVVLAWLSIALSFSRFLLFCAFLAHVAFWFTERKKPLFISLLKFLVVLGCVGALVGPDRIQSVIERRFFSTDNTRSDSIREHQINELMIAFEEAPYMGKGLGGYAEKAVRDPKLKYSYEVQWVAFLMQFGLIGIVGLFIPIFLVSFRMLNGRLTRLKVSLFAMFCVWLIAGFTNPFLISLASGLVYALFYGAAKQQSDIMPVHA